MTFEKEYNGRTITFSSDVELLKELENDGKPFVLLIDNENRFEDVSFSKYAIDVESFDPTAYDDEGEYVDEDGSSSLSEEEILEIADDEYCRMLIARFEGVPVLIAQGDDFKVKELSTDDTEDLMNLYNDVKPAFLQRFFDTYDDAKEYIQKYIDQVYSFYNYGIWGIYLEEDSKDKLIGLVGFTPRETRVHEIGEYGYNYKISLEIGFAIDAKYRRQGYGYKASCAAIEYAKEHIPHESILVNIASDNIPAIGLAKKLNLIEQ